MLTIRGHRYSHVELSRIQTNSVANCLTSGQSLVLSWMDEVECERLACIDPGHTILAYQTNRSCEERSSSSVEHQLASMTVNVGRKSVQVVDRS